jgi:hypothetical protein
VAAIDGMLVWTNMPCKKTDDLQIGPAKFFNGRKGKYGMNLQGTCGPNKKFLDVTCSHPGSASDFTMWLDSDLRKRVETPGYLMEGLVIYGDNAYVNTTKVVSPFKQVSSGPKDAFNFYQSQLRITIEGAFGMLVHKWAVLRKPMNTNLPVSSISRWVLALCKLHNFCIDEREAAMENLQLTVDDNFHVAMEGGFTLDSADVRIDELLDGGLDPEDPAYRNALRAANRREDLPYRQMLQYIEDNGYERPAPQVPSPNNI